jgi:hypothetical protein
MAESDRTVKQKEPWLRQHKLTVLAIIIAFFALIGTWLSATGAWLKFPFIVSLLGLEKLNADSNSDSEEPSIKDVTFTSEFTEKAVPLFIRVTSKANSDTLFEIYRKKTDSKPFQSFTYKTPVEDISFKDLDFDGSIDFLVREIKLESPSAHADGYKVFVYDYKTGGFSLNNSLSAALDFVYSFDSDKKRKELNTYIDCAPGTTVKTVYSIDSDSSYAAGEKVFKATGVYSIDRFSGNKQSNLLESSNEPFSRDANDFRPCDYVSN